MSDTLVIEQLAVRARQLAENDVTLTYSALPILEQLKKTLVAQKNTPSPLYEAAERLLIKIYIQFIADSQAQEPITRVDLFMACRYIQELLIEKDSSFAVKELAKIADRGTCDQAKEYALPKQFFFTCIDGVVNAVNVLRSIFFNAHYDRWHNLGEDFISSDLKAFLRIAAHPSALIPFSKLMPQEDEAKTNYLNAEVKQKLEDLKQKQDFVVSADVESLISALNDFARNTFFAETHHHEVLKNKAQSAFWVCQDMVLEILDETPLDTLKVRRLTNCFQQTAAILENPGDKVQIMALKALIDSSDYKRYSCDREKSCYAVIHMVVAAALLAYAVTETVMTAAANVLVQSFTLAAEGISLGVGVWQFRYFLGSQIKDTVFNESMDTLCKSMRINYTGIAEVPEHLTEHAQNLQDLLEQFAASCEACDDPILQFQANKVLGHAKLLFNDLLYDKETTEKQLIAFSQALCAANIALRNPHEADLAMELFDLAQEGAYENRRLDTSSLLLGFFLLLACVAIYLITITATILSLGATAGTIISPIMLSALAINKMVSSVKRDRTEFSDEAQKLSHFGKRLFFKPLDNEYGANLEADYIPARELLA